MANGWGGKREGAGRKRRADEELLIERLDKIIEPTEVIEKLKELCLKGNTKALTLYLSYRFGKPKESIDINVETMQPIFQLPTEDIETIELSDE